jgi:ABC-type phosphate transport system substrate-binding protein
MIQVFDTDENRVVYAQKVDVENLTPMICALANQLGIQEVRLSGSTRYAFPYMEEIKTAYSLNYGNNNINVEVL